MKTTFLILSLITANCFAAGGVLDGVAITPGTKTPSQLYSEITTKGFSADSLTAGGNGILMDSPGSSGAKCVLKTGGSTYDFPSQETIGNIFCSLSNQFRFRVSPACTISASGVADC